MHKFLSIICLAGLMSLPHVKEVFAHDDVNDVDAKTCVKQVQEYWSAFSRLDAAAELRCIVPKESMQQILMEVFTSCQDHDG